MLNKLKKLFSEEKNTSDAEIQKNLQIAAAVLMIEVSKSDDSIDSVELEKIKSIMADTFKLDQTNSDTLLEQAKQESEQAVSLHEFTREICDRYKHLDRIVILKNLWEVAFADGRIDQHERHFIRKIAGLLYLTDNDITLAKAQAQR